MITDFTTRKRRLPHLESPGGWYSVDSRTHDSQILAPVERDIVLNAFLFFHQSRYDLNAVVIMPDHFHAILHPLECSPGRWHSLSDIFHSIKSYTAKAIIKHRKGEAGHVGKHYGASNIHDNQGLAASTRTHSPKHNRTGLHVWQDEIFDHIIRNEKDYYEKLRYLINNPVNAGLAEEASQYPWLWYAFADGDS